MSPLHPRLGAGIPLVTNDLETKVTLVEQEGVDMEPLSDKTYMEQRENFVRARFAESASFGRPDIEEWVIQQWETRTPDRSMTGFGRFGGLIVKNAGHPLTIEYLDRYATPVRRAGNWQRWAMLAGSSYSKIILAAMAGGAKLYRSDDCGPVFIVDGVGFCADHRRIEKLNPATFLDAVFSEWVYHGPRGGVAREFICRAMSLAIANARENAQRDFDKAVAVSVDGKKIVSADKVYLIEKGYTKGILYSAEALQMNKIFIYNLPCRRTVYWNEGKDIDTFCLRLLTTHTYHPNFSFSSTYLITDPGGYIEDFGRVYVVDCNWSQQRLPSPLPEGGREIRIP